MSKVVRVAVGVIEDALGRILIARRPEHVHQGGLWEFPGGKVDEGEALSEALARELQEELAIRVINSEPLIEIRHDYPDKSVLLQVRRVSRFEGQPKGNEGQPVRWVAPEDLPGFAFPAANRPIIHAIRLPRQIVITGSADSPEDWWRRFHQTLDYVQSLPVGHAWIQLRAPSLSLENFRTLAREAAGRCRDRGVALLAHGSLTHCMPELDGLHMNGSALAECKGRPVPISVWWGASCHSPEELAHAVALGVDYVMLSPVKATMSHPEAVPLGWEQFAEWVAEVPLPVYALGGVGSADLPVAQAAGAQGVAGIGFVWGAAVDVDESLAVDQ